MTVGTPVRRLEDGRFLRGEGRYTDDLAPADALHAFFLRSPHAHATIRGMDAMEARAMPGVAAVWIGRDAEAAGLGHLAAFSEIFDEAGQRHREPRHLPIAADRVRHVGEIVAMVVAHTPAAARDAAEAIAVEYEPLPAAVSASAALDPAAPQLHDEAPGNLLCDWRKGDPAAVAAAFARAHRVVRRRHRFNRITAGYLETRAYWASHDTASGVTTLTGSTQGSHILHRFLTQHVLGWAPDSLRVVTPDVGGGFGPKFALYPEAALVAWAARALGRPVRWICERAESMVADNHARDLEAEIALALDADGRFLAIRVDAVAGFGAWISLFAPTIPTTGMARTLAGLYRIPAMHIAMRCAFTNTTPVDAFRGAGKPETFALLEGVIDAAAAELGKDAIELRRRNLLQPADFPHTTPLGYRYDAGDYQPLLDAALRQADMAGLPGRRQASEAAGRLRGFGLACHLHPTGGLADEQASVRLLADGTVEALTGTQSQGQGHETVMAQLVGGVLTLPPETVRVLQGDTARIPRGGGTGGSSSTIISGTVLVHASEQVVRQARLLAAELLEASPVDLALKDGAIEIAGTDRRVPLPELARIAAERGTPLQAEAGFEESLESWPAGVMTCEVEIDPATGHVTVEHLDAAVDIGTVVNPMLVEGQMHGGMAAGLGQALLEDAVYDPSSAQLLAGSWMDYTLPRADDLPMMTVSTHGTPTMLNSLGIKGVGELPTNGAPAAVAAAVLAALRPLGVRELPTPATPERIWRAIAEAAQRGT